MKIKEAVFKCDICEAETNEEFGWVFQRKGYSGSIHEVRHYFGLCDKCTRKASDRSVLKRLMNKVLRLVG